MSPWDRLLQQPQRRSHFVQLYDEDRSALAQNVVLYISEGLNAGDGVLVIATPAHWDLFTERLAALGFDVRSRLKAGQLVFLDALETLSSFMSGGQPDWYRFERVMRTAMRRLRTPPEGAGLRAYGEMVALLWNARQFSAAIRLEQFWNKLLAQSSFSLYCSYAIDVFGKEFHPDALDALLRTHTHLVPAESGSKLEEAFDWAVQEVLGRDADGFKRRIRAQHRPSWAVMPDTESTILWVRKNLPQFADEITERARAQYRRLTTDAQPALHLRASG